jgi:hypothetical protein
MRQAGSQDGTPRRVRTWPVLVICLPASVAIWSGWIGLGQMTGFGVMHPLPGLVKNFEINTAVTLPVGMEAYAAFALYVWLARGMPTRARRFARWSAILSLTVGASGQVAYHLLTALHIKSAPWWVTTVVACLPVAVVGMGGSLIHLLRNQPTEAGHEPQHQADRQSWVVRYARDLSQARAELTKPVSTPEPIIEAPRTPRQITTEPRQTPRPLRLVAQPEPDRAKAGTDAGDESDLTPLLRQRLTDLLTEYGAEPIPGRTKVMPRMRTAGYDGWTNSGEAGRLIKIAKARQARQPRPGNGREPATEERPQQLIGA